MPSSSIDTSGIDVDYPVAGEDNDSQGFRTNFTEIKAALDAATSDINTLFVTGGYTGSKGTFGYTGSASIAAGYTGSAGAGGGGGSGYTGSASSAAGYTGSAGAGGGGSGYTGSASTVVGPQGPLGYTGSAGTSGGSSLLYQTTSFTATVNSQYVVDTTSGSITITLPATPTTGNYISFTAKNLQTNTVTVTDGALISDVYDKVTDGARYYYDGADWQKIEDGTVRSYGNTSNYYEVAVFDDNASNVIHRSPVRIWYDDGNVEIPAPNVASVNSTLFVTGFGGYTGSANDPAKPAIQSNGAAFTTTVEVSQSGTTIDIDCGLSNVFYTLVTGTISTINLNNPSDGQTINWFIKKESARTVTWPAGWLWQNGIPSAVTAAASTDILTATYLAATSSWYVTLLTDMKVGP